MWFLLLLNYFSCFVGFLRIVNVARSLGYISVKVLLTVGVQTLQQLLRGDVTKAREIGPGASVWIIFKRLLDFADIAEIAVANSKFLLFVIA
jgi:hypothetical protein